MRAFAGKPLVQHAMETAFNSGRFRQVFVTSDDPLVLALAERGGAVPLPRPQSIASDDATMADVVRHVDASIREAGHDHGEAFALMQPTTPLRAETDIAGCVDRFEAGNWASAASVCALDHPPQKALIIDGDRLEPLFGWGSLQANRQRLSPAFRQNGAIWIVRWTAFRESGQFVVAPAMPFVMDKVNSIDIDTQQDFDEAEAVFRSRRTESV